VKLHTKKVEDLQNDKKKIKDSETSKYENKKLSKFTRRKTNTSFPPPPTPPHTKKNNKKKKPKKKKKKRKNHNPN